MPTLEELIVGLDGYLEQYKFKSEKWLKLFAQIYAEAPLGPNTIAKVCDMAEEIYD